jgi:hypothetical protein
MCERPLACLCLLDLLSAHQERLVLLSFRGNVHGAIQSMMDIVRSVRRGYKELRRHRKFGVSIARLVSEGRQE